MIENLGLTPSVQTALPLLISPVKSSEHFTLPKHCRHKEQLQQNERSSFYPETKCLEMNSSFEVYGFQIMSVRRHASLRRKFKNNRIIILALEIIFLRKK